mgnify:CR=1 FL=1
MVKVQLPYHLQTLARCGSEIEVDVQAPVSVLATVRAVEKRYPMLQGTLIDHDSNQRRPKIRFFACNEDWSLKPIESALPETVSTGREPLLIVGAISGG